MNKKAIIISAFLFLGILIAEVSAQKPKSRQCFTMALTGDCIITRRLAVYDEPAFIKMIDLLRSADMAFTNLEVLFHDYESYPMHQSGGTYMRSDPDLAQDLVWAGFDLVARANNHTGDYGVEGMRLTTKHIEAAGLVHAGVGESLTQAREARFMEAGKGRVALISCASTFPDHCRAGKTRGDIPARPGLNPLRYSTTHVVERDDLETLRRIFKGLGLRVSDEGPFDLLGKRFESGEQTHTRTAPHAEDLSEISSVVRNASRLADYTIVTFHSHESSGERSDPADFLVEFNHAMIDAGADVCVGHGPHVLRGIEIYKGKPIFYSLGDFMFQNETLLRLPDENYARYQLGPEAHVADFNSARYSNDTKGFPATPEIWEAVIAVPRWHDKALIDIRLVPISLGHGQSRTVRGRPMMVDKQLGDKILDDLIRLSKPYGTSIEVKDGVGVIRIE